MPTTKQIIELYQDDYVNSIKRNMDVIAQELKNQVKKKNFLTPANVELLASHGLGLKIISNMYGENTTDISNSPELMAAYERGRALIGSHVRASLVDDALNKDILQAKLHLDKVFNKEEYTQDINLTVTQSPLKDVTNEQLLQIDLDDNPDQS